MIILLYYFDKWFCSSYRETLKTCQSHIVGIIDTQNARWSGTDMRYSTYREYVTYVQYLVSLACENSSTPLQSLRAIRHMRVNGAYLFMVSSWMIFGEVVSYVCVSW